MAPLLFPNLVLNCALSISNHPIDVTRNGTRGGGRQAGDPPRDDNFFELGWPPYSRKRRRISMATMVTPPSTETERPPADNTTNGSSGGGSDVPSGLGHDILQLEPEHRATPASAHRLITFLAMIWITALFA